MSEQKNKPSLNKGNKQNFSEPLLFRPYLFLENSTSSDSCYVVFKKPDNYSITGITFDLPPHIEDPETDYNPVVVNIEASETPSSGIEMSYCEAPDQLRGNKAGIVVYLYEPEAEGKKEKGRNKVLYEDGDGNKG
jgi:hypothetical protein